MNNYTPTPILQPLIREVGKDVVENIIYSVAHLEPERLTPQFAKLANLMELDQAEELFRQALCNEDAVTYRKAYEEAQLAKRMAEIQKNKEELAARKKEQAERRKERRAKNQELAKKGLRVCPRCGGAGGASAWRRTGFTCYRCNGTGTVLKGTR